RKSRPETSSPAGSRSCDPGFSFPRIGHASGAERPRRGPGTPPAPFSRPTTMDLTSTYLGFALPHPLMPGASPMVDDLDMVRRLEDAGASAIVMHSLFEEQIAAEGHTAGYVAPFGEALSLYLAPANVEDEALVMLSDILPTGFECGVLNGQV